MKQLLTVIIITISSLAAMGQVAFFEGTWEEAFAKAEETGKHVFVDAYTDWCYWCKVMDKETFTDADIAAYLNEEFIPIKVNMEKGFGKNAALKYRVTVFPTTLYFNPQGELLKKKPGYEADNDKFLAHLEEIRADKREKVFGFDSQDFDIDYPYFLEDRFGLNGERKRANKDTVNMWLSEQDNLFTEAAWTVMTNLGADKKYEKHIMENSEKYASMFGAGEFDDVVTSAVYGKVAQAGKDKDQSMFDEALAMLDKHLMDKESVADYKNNFEMSFLQATENWEAYTMKADAELKKKSLEDQVGLANSVAWTLYEKCEDPKCLKIMEEWMAKVIELDPEYAYLDTYAALLYKNGDFPKAKQYAEAAIEAGKKDESNVDDTTALLEKIEASMDDDGQ